MARETITITEAREQGTSEALKWIFLGAGIILLAFFLRYFLHLFLQGGPLIGMRRGMLIGAVAGFCVAVGGGIKYFKLRELTGVAFPCPYCDQLNQLVAPPESDFECENCHQTVRFDEKGTLIPVKIINCSNCNTDNKVSSKATRFICSKCNATIQVQADQPVYGMGNVRPTAPVRPTMLLNHANFDVLISAFDHARQGQLASSLEGLLGVEAAEARRLLSTVTDRTPLIVGVDMAQLDAEQLQAQLTQLGAKVVLRPR